MTTVSEILAEQLEQLSAQYASAINDYYANRVKSFFKNDNDLYWIQSAASDVIFTQLNMSGTTGGNEAPNQIFIKSASGGAYGGVPNTTGSQKHGSFVFCRKQTGVPGFTGKGSLIGYTAIIDAEGVDEQDYDPLNPSTTYQEAAAFGGYTLVKRGGLGEGGEFRITVEGTAPTTAYGLVSQIVNNNTNTTQNSAGMLIQSNGTYAAKFGIDMTGKFNIGLDTTGTTLDANKYAINIAPTQRINIGGNSKATFVASSDGTDIRFNCDNVYSFSFNQYGMRAPHDVYLLPGSGAPTTIGTGYAETGSMYVDYANGNLYINAGTKATPSWKLVTRAA